MYIYLLVKYSPNFFFLFGRTLELPNIPFFYHFSSFLSYFLFHLIFTLLAYCDFSIFLRFFKNPNLRIWGFTSILTKNISKLTPVCLKLFFSLIFQLQFLPPLHLLFISFSLKQFFPYLVKSTSIVLMFIFLSLFFSKLNRCI